MWLKHRLREASTWAGISAWINLFYIWTVLPDTLHKHWLVWPAIGAAFIAIVMEEKGRD